MAFDGITVAAVAAELKKDLLNSRIYKIAQPESDELIITDGGQKRLLLSADASLPLTYFTSQNKPSPMTAPSFTMLLRKHLQNGRITGITQPGLERIIELHVEHYNDMGDLCHKRSGLRPAAGGKGPARLCAGGADGKAQQHHLRE